MLNIFFLHKWQIDRFQPKPKGFDRNFIGDSTISEALGKYILKNYKDIVGCVDRYSDDEKSIPLGSYSVGISINDKVLQGQKCKHSIWYCQDGYDHGYNAFEKYAKDYDGILLAGKQMHDTYKDYVTRSGHKPIFFPFATDLEKFYPAINLNHQFDIAYCGNDIKEGRTAPMIKPCLQYNFALYGRWIDEELLKISQGQINDEDLREVYSTSTLLLNFHLSGASKWGMYAGRIYDILACKGLCITDDAYGLEDFFKGAEICVVSDGDELPSLLEFLIPQGKILNNNRQWIVDTKNTWEDRADTLMKYIKEFI